MKQIGGAILSDEQFRAFVRAADFPERVVLSRVVMTEAGAATLVTAGLWEVFFERFHGNLVPRYRFTETGRAALAEIKP